MLGANGIVGGGIGLAGGAALSASIRRSGQIALCFFGEGAINQGAFHEVSNMAAIWSLPLVLVCENNRFAMSGRVERMTAVDDLSHRAAAYGFRGVSVDGMDVLAVHDVVAEAAGRARAGEGPSLVVATCYRFAGHFSGDTMRYRTAEEAEPWLARDPIAAFRARLVAEGVLSDDGAERMVAEAEATIRAAVEFAKTSPLPDPASAFEDVHA
jgi:pyruvate dehydrogenase E1 component alpha subunit